MQRATSSLTTRLLLLVVLVFASSVGMVYWIIEQQGKPEVAKLTSETVIETGNEAINSINSQMSNIDGIAYTASRMISSLPKQATLINTSFKALMSQMDSRILGGGLWYDLNMFNPNIEEQAFVWQRQTNGNMQPNPTYQAINPAYTNVMPEKNLNKPASTPPTKLATPYYRDWWYVPAMYANHDHCVWSSAYRQTDTQVPMMTCAMALHNTQTKGFEGVISLDVALNRLQETSDAWQKKTGGYLFLVDRDNNFLTFPKTEEMQRITANKQQGETLSIADYAKLQPDFMPIAEGLATINQALIAKAKAIDPSKFDFTANVLVSSTNLQKTNLSEAQNLTAMLWQEGLDSAIVSDHFVRQVETKNDAILHETTTAFIFLMPSTHWKMVIVKPNKELMALANRLGKQLQWSLLLGFIPMLLLSAYVFRQVAVVPLRRVARVMRSVGELIEQKHYLNLGDYKLPKASVTEVAVISDAMNQLIDRVVENEGTLAKVNEHLEQQVVERTAHLDQTLKKLKSSQVQLVQAEKMATLGQMVAGVAHEVNTPLGYVKSNLTLIKNNLVRYDDLLEATQQLKQHIDLAKPLNVTEQGAQPLQQVLRCSDELIADELSEDLQGLIEDAQFGVTQISELVINLRDFSRIDQAKIKAVSINDCIKNSLSMARSNIKCLTVTTQLDSHTPVQCNPSQINQVLLNLFNNAAQAMPDNYSGKLTVRSYEDADNVYISVEDNGKGIPDDIKAQIFEPFFTTKKAGEGTGLGLAISAQIIEQHHGKITVTSTLNIGTCFTICLPKQAEGFETSPKLAISN